MGQSSTEATAYDSWADYYDLGDCDRAPFIAFYRNLLGDRTRSIVELGCGTGTIVSALAERLKRRDGNLHGIRIVGIDGSEGMLKIARSRDADLEWVFGDIRTPPVQGRFDLAFCCFNTLQHLLRDEDLLQALVSARELLVDDGIFAFDIYQPNIAYLSIEQKNRLARSITDGQGRHLEIRENTVYDADAHILSLQWRMVDRDKPDQPPLARTGYRLRQYFAAEILRMLAGAGLVVHERYGDFDRSPFDEHSKKQILVCGRK
jgi:SAM-dependent methyltransferase